MHYVLLTQTQNIALRSEQIRFGVDLNVCTISVETVETFCFC